MSTGRALDREDGRNGLRRVDEDAWVVPDAWWAKAARFRGRGPVRAMRPGKKPSGWHVRLPEPESVRSGLEVTALAGARDISAAGLATLDGTAVTPLGVAAVAVCGHRYLSGSYTVPALDTPLPDQWVAEYGAVFAAEAAALAVGMALDRPNHGGAHVRWVEAEELPPGGAMGIAHGVRGHLANLPDADYADAVAALQRCRTEITTLPVRLAASYLAPTEQHWLDEDLAAIAGTRGRSNYLWPLLANSATTVAQLEVLAAECHNGALFASLDEPLYSAIVHVGPSMARMIAKSIDLEWLDAAQPLGALLAHFPTDEAFGILLDRAAVPAIRGPLIEAAQRFPRRAFRMLTAREPGHPMRADLLRTLAQIYPDLAGEIGVPVAGVASSLVFEGICASEDLPEFLRTPPWEREVRAAPPTVISGLRGTEIRVRWQPGERERWLEQPSKWYEPERDWPAYIEKTLRATDSRGWWWGRLFADAPLELITPHLAALRAADIAANSAAAPLILARFEDAVAPRITEAAQSSPVYLAPVLQAISGAEVTNVMVRLLTVRKHRDTALTWLGRHIDTAAKDLIAAALDKPGTQRNLAWTAVHTLVASGYRADLLTAAATFGGPVAAAFETELTADPLSRLPSRIPPLPTWLLPIALPALILRENRRALPADAAGAICVMLAMHGPGGHYPGVLRVKEIIDPRSLAEFAWALFEAWRTVGYPAATGWVLPALGVFGDDDTARRLTPLIRAWPGESAHQRAVNGLDALAAIGTDRALMHLNGIAEKVKFAGIRTKARERIQQLAEARELTTDQLADRLVPRLGLSDDGTLRLDYGPRSFVIGFDEALTPIVSDADGTRRKSLPKPGAKDDPEAGPLAYKAFTTLKKDVKSLAQEQLRRLERAMVQGRRWTVGEHRRLFIDHPLLWHLSRRLVWAAFDDAGTVARAFRIAEDRTLADLRDVAFAPSDDLRIGIAHPLQLTEDLPDWIDLFTAYELLQPFPQLTRDTYALTDAERAGTDLTRFTGIKVPPTRVQGMTARGWERQAPQDAGNSNCFHRPVSQEFSVVVDIYPGLSAGIAPTDHDPQELPHIHISARGQEDQLRYSTPHPFGVLDAVTASEILRDLVHLTT